MKFITYKGVHWNIAQIVDISAVVIDKGRNGYSFSINFTDGSQLIIDNVNESVCLEIHATVLNFCMTVGGSNVLEIS